MIIQWMNIILKLMKFYNKSKKVESKWILIINIIMISMSWNKTISKNIFKINFKLNSIEKSILLEHQYHRMVNV